jgi:hypothetical protein
MESAPNKVRNTAEWNRVRTKVNKYLSEQKKQIDMQNKKIEALIDIINKINDQGINKNNSKKQKSSSFIIGFLILVIICLSLYIYFN